MRNSLRTLTLSAVLLTLVAAPALAAPAADGEVLVPTSARVDLETRETLDALLYEYALFDLDTKTIAERVREQGTVSLHLGNQTFHLRLELNDMRAPGYRAVVITDGKELEVDPGPVVTYKGSLVDDPDAVVRARVEDSHFEGYVRTAHDWVFIDPLDRYVDGAPRGTVVFYRDSAVRPEAAGLCGSEHLNESIRAVGLDLPGDFQPGIASRAPKTIQVATEGDGQHYQRYGNPGTFNQAATILNNVDGVYRSDLNLTISITYQQAWSSVSGDPYTSLDATTTLYQFRDWWNANRGGTVRDTAHMFSGKNFNGGTIGIAWVGVVCNNPSLSYGISEDQQNSFLNKQLTAHEIGHNLSAGHDNQTPVCSGVNCNGFGPIMCSFIQSSGTNKFSSCSKSSINNHVSTYGSCLN